MFDDEDNNPYGSFKRRDSNNSDVGYGSSPGTPFARPSTPPSATPSPPPEFKSNPGKQSNHDGINEAVADTTVQKKKSAYDSRVEQILYENPDLQISITYAGKNVEGGGSYIAYTICTGDLEVRRRYSDFSSLRKTLVELHPTLIIPPIPEKHTMADYAAKPTKAKEDAAIIDYRKRMLSSFLNRCRRMKDVREDGVFWKFLDPNASWSEVLHSHPVSSLPKNSLKAPPLDPANPTPGHNFLPVPSATAKLKSAKDQSSSSGPPTSPPSYATLSSSAGRSPPRPQIFGRFPLNSSDLSEQELDPYFANFEASSRELENLLQGSMEKVNRRTLSHLSAFSEDLAELGARFNGFSLSEQSSTLAAAIEKMGQAVDSTYIATGDLSQSLSASFSEPMRESAQFAGIVRNVLRYRILKRVQEEMTKDELEKKKSYLTQLEASEMEAKRIEEHLTNSGFVSPPPPKGSVSSGPARGSQDRSRTEEDTASIDSDFPPLHTDDAPSSTQGAPLQRSEPTSPTGNHKKNVSGNSVTNKIFGKLNYAIHGMVDVDPERTRRDQIGKTKESLVQLEQALQVSEKDVRDASTGVLGSLKSFQKEKEGDLRRYMIAYARCHIDWAKRNMAHWEDAKRDVEHIDEYEPLPSKRSYLSTLPSTSHGDRFALLFIKIAAALSTAKSTRQLSLRRYRVPAARAALKGQLFVKTSSSKKRKLTQYTRRGSKTPFDKQDHALFTNDEDYPAVGIASPRSSPYPSSPRRYNPSPTPPRFVPQHNDEPLDPSAANSRDCLRDETPPWNYPHSFVPGFKPLNQPQRVMPGSDDNGPVPSNVNGPASAQFSSPPSVSFTESNMRNLGIGARTCSPGKRTRSRSDDEDDQSGMDIDSVGGAPRSPKKKSMQHVSPMPNRPKKMDAKINGQRLAPLDLLGGPQPTPTHGPSSDGSSGSHHEADPSDASSRSTPPTSIDTDAMSTVDTPTTSSKLPTLDQQVTTIKNLADKQVLVEGFKGYVISTKWLTRVISRTTHGLNWRHEKSALEGSIGAVDNSDIVEMVKPGLRDQTGNQFASLKLAMQLEHDFEILPQEAWDLVVEWYGCLRGSVIPRYVHNTSDSLSPNFQYELFPPVITIRKLRDDGVGSKLNLELPAAQLVASRSESIQNFMKRAKLAVGIDMSVKVRVWRVSETLEPRDGRSTIPTPASSRHPSPGSQAAVLQVLPPLVVDLHTFTSMEEGNQRERLDIMKDQTMNDKYNGSSTLGNVGFSAFETLILEEQVQGSDSEESASGKMKKDAAKNGVNRGTGQIDYSTVQSDVKSKVNTGNTRRSPTPPGMMTRGRMRNKARRNGTTGLQNLGNTCYMNSALQCIRSVEELTTFFVAENYKSELNADNPLGHNGAIAKAYAGFLTGIYGESSSFAPRNFKNTLGRCQPLFSGYGQQDSQEFLSFLVDGLHEDLNRIHKKPYMENPESDDKIVRDPEAIKALGDKYRANHRARNDSIAMDLFSGSYKNTVVCPVCEKISITFDPFSLLTLQLPIEATWQHTVTFAPLRGAPVDVRIDIDKNSNIRMLKEHVANKFLGVKAENMIMGEIYSEKLYKFFEENEIIQESNIQSADKLWIWQLDETPTNWLPRTKTKRASHTFFTMSNNSPDGNLPEMGSEVADRMAVPLVHRRKHVDGHFPFDHVLYPSLILINREEAKDYDSILRKVLQRVETMTSRKMFPDEDASQQNFTSRAESDAMMMTDEDGSSSDELKIQAKSVEGEDDVVDVSTSDKRDLCATQDDDCESSAESSTLRPVRSAVLNPSYFIDPDIRNLFDMHYYSSTTELIPTQYSTLSNIKAYPLIDSRLPQVMNRRSSASSWDSHRSHARDRHSSLSSDDGIRSDKFYHSPPIDNESDDDGLPSPSELTRNPQLSFSCMDNPGRYKTYSKKGKKRAESSSLKSEPEENYLIRLGEGIIIDWNSQGFNQLFEGAGGSDERGEPIIKSIAMLQDPELDARKAKRMARRKNGVTLDECFTETSKSEVLSEENAWYCGRCKELRRATKTLEIWSVPDILVVHLKRFSANSRMRDKIDIFVDFPTKGLNLNGRVGLPENKSLVYDLFAVDNHYGGLGGGHYTAYAENFYDYRWYEYNDAHVSQVTPASIVTSAAYLLFYRRRTDTPLGPPYLQDIVNNARNPDLRSESGEDQRRDDSYSRNGSSNGSLGPAVEAEASHHPLQAGVYLGSAGGSLRSAQESMARSAIGADLPPAYNDDEGISMEGPDNPLPCQEQEQELEDGQLLGNHHYSSNWAAYGFRNLEHAATAPPTSDNGMEDCETLSNPASDAPAVGSESGDVRILTDFADDLTEEYRAIEEHRAIDESIRCALDNSPTPEIEVEERLPGGQVRHVERVHDVRAGGPEDFESEGSVAEVRVDDEEGA